MPKHWESRVLWVAGFMAAFFGSHEAINLHQWFAFAGFCVVWSLMTTVYIFGRRIG